MQLKMARREGLDSDDDDDFVLFGTALQPFKEDGLPRKPVPVQDQPMQDARGRAVRFHGAFTGGFSAGYFNTVGSKEGWKPSTFSSSRSGKGDRQKQNVEDFMDTEDFSEHGIAPRRITTTDNFTAKSVNSKSESLFEGVIPGNAPLQDVVTSAELSIGIRLLRKLGWKEGQGIGPRVKRKRKKRRKPPATESSQRVYGCALPSSPGHESEESDDYEDIATDVSFAPKDVNPISFVAKDNVHGIGYSGIQSTNTLGDLNLIGPKPISRSGKKGITGRAFGVGALEKDDDDIYAVDSMQNYDFEMGGPDESKTHGWTAPSNTGSHQKALQFPDALPGFKMASSKLKQKKVYKPPQLPRHFRPFHVFPTVGQNNTTTTSTSGKQLKQLDANTRRDLIDDPPTVKSVFELVSDADKKKLDSIQKPSLPASVTPDDTSRRKDSTVSGDSSRSSTGDITGSMTPAQSTSQLVASSWKPVTTTGQSFKPFEKDPAKQTRYETYSGLIKQGHRDAYNELETNHMTEWEKQREREEFSKASQLYRPLSFMMASRFTRAKYDDDADKDQAQEKVEDSDQAKAAKMNLFGKLTRETFEWHPDKLICRRFNVPNPYPESTIVGLHKDNREKLSVFNFLNFSYQQNPEPKVSKSEIADKPQTPELKGPNVKGRVSKGFKPLSILATSDLVTSHDPSSNNSTQSATVAAASDREIQQLGGEDSAERESDDEARPPMDLFKAIFSDSDASESSHDEEDEDEKQIGRPGSLQTAENNMQLQVITSEGLPTSKSGEEQRECATIEVVSLEDRLSPADKSVIEEGPDKQASTSVTGTVKVFAGPALPPSFNVNTTPILDPGKEQKPTSLLERFRDEHRKQKHRHKDKHRHKHSKKSSKHKRDKHKKKKDKKKKKRKAKEKVLYVSSESEDTESADDSSSDGSFQTDKIFEKLKSVMR